MKKMKFVTRKHLLYKTRVEYGSWAINHYEGCKHGCKYCWAMRLAFRTGRVKTRREWLHPKAAKNAPDQVFAEIHSANFQDRFHREYDWVWLCPATDPYQLIESELHLTSSILKHLVQSQIPVRILTKSEGVYDDEDTIIRHSDLVQVGFTISTLSNDLARSWEPDASLIHDRMKALRYFHNNGVKTWVSGEPILDSKPLDFVEELNESVDYWVFGKANYMKLPLDYPKIRNGLIQWFQAHNQTNYYIKKELMEAA